MKDEKDKDSDLDPQTLANQIRRATHRFCGSDNQAFQPIAKDSGWQAHLRTNSPLWNISSAELW